MTPSAVLAPYQWGRLVLGDRRPGDMGTMRGAGTAEEEAVARSGGRRNPRADDGLLGPAVARARAGDEDAFALVYRTLHPMLLGYVRGLVGDAAHDADEVAAAAWHDIIRGLDGFRGDAAAFRGWAAAIARRRALDHLRRTGSRPAATAPRAGTAPEAPDPAGTAPQDISTTRAIALIGALPPDQAEAVLLRVLLGLSVPAAARVLGERPGAVRTAAHRGLRTLANRLAAPGTGPGAPDPDPYGEA